MTRNTTPPAPRPLLLEAAGHTCVAWWHAPAPAGALPMAVVLASSWGEEDMSAYDGLRELALALAADGLGVLRFEWPDTGDSSAPTGSATLAHAQAAFDAAASRARVLSGCGRLAFAGIRLGALLAAHAAAARDDVQSLVALLPVAGGRAFVREQRLLGARLTGDAPPPDRAASDTAALPVPLGGFSLPAQQAEALSALKWPTAMGGLRDALLVMAADVPAGPVADALAAAGVHVNESLHQGLSDVLAVAHQARLAPAAIDAIARWLRQRPEAMRPQAGAAPVPGAVADPAWMRLSHAGTALRERVVHVGAPGQSQPPGLVGVIAESDPSEAVGARAPRRGIVLLSAGRERRIGPHRAWVAYARHRAANGDVVLRLDLAGIGDSSPHSCPDADGLPAQYDPRAVDDVVRALAWLRREHGVGPCTVMGMCSGAFNAWHAALAGANVQQVVLLNPLVFHVSPGMSFDPMDNDFGQIHVAASAGRALLDPARWRKLLAGRANVAVITGAIAARARGVLRLRLRAAARLLGLPLANDLAAELHRVVDRGVAVDFVFSFREPGLTLLREEAGRRGMKLASDNRINVCVIAHADHTFAGSAGRAELYARLDTLLLTPSPMTSPSVVPDMRHPVPTLRRGPGAGPLPGRPALPSGEWPTYPSDEGLT